MNFLDITTPTKVKTFHGGARTSINNIISYGIDKTKGHGELGMGYYTGSRISAAATWAQIKAKQNKEIYGMIIEHDIQYLHNSLEWLKLNEHRARNLGIILKDIKYINYNSYKTFVFNVDTITSPIVGNPKKIEAGKDRIKWESDSSISYIQSCNRRVIKNVERYL